jgi:5-bromo-4-chloroindolyl phosphate hydrolysis protein
MAKFHRAEEVFKDIPSDIRTRIFAIARGKLVYFPKNSSNKKITNLEGLLIKYAKNKNSYNQMGEQFGVSKVRIYHIVNQERERFSRERIEYWKNLGLSLKEIGRLFKKSPERVRQIQQKL